MYEYIRVLDINNLVLLKNTKFIFVSKNVLTEINLIFYLDRDRTLSCVHCTLYIYSIE